MSHSASALFFDFDNSASGWLRKHSRFDDLNFFDFCPEHLASEYGHASHAFEALFDRLVDTPPAASFGVLASAGPAYECLMH